MASSSHSDHVYDLRLVDGCSDGFFANVAGFCDALLEQLERRAAPILDGYSRHVQMKRCEAPRGRGEYALDLLTLGMVLRIYAPRAEKTPQWAVAAASALVSLRHHAPWLKPAADLARGALFKMILDAKSGPQNGREASPIAAAENNATPLQRLPRLIHWLRATGELEQEALRLDHWRSYLSTLDLPRARRSMALAGELFDDFEREAATVLGPYTQGVEKFLATEYAGRGFRHSFREDQLFCGRVPAEYHLNMAAAEMMNRGLRMAFERTLRKAVLVPACMRGAQAASCKAKVRGVDMTCSACDPECAVNRITRRMRPLGATVYLVTHTSGFSRWLDRWEREPGVGVVAVACLLNILPGGYEMRERRIASQCLPLDFPGCKKHWDPKGISTAVNEDRLVQIAAERWP